MAKIIELILTEQRTGLGKLNDPIRMVTQLWTKDGKLVAERDSAEGLEIFNHHTLNHD